MNLPTPRWWYQRDQVPGPVVRALLRPVSWLWTYVTARRIAKTVPTDGNVPVICVGNLTVGGTGKTPVVRAILDYFASTGIAAHSLSRGYGGRLSGPVRVDPQTHLATDVGDEPLMLATGHPVWISRDRVAGARAAAASGAKVVVMDDGHQNPSLKKTLSLIVLDGETRNGEWPLGDGSVVPAGPLREPLAAGLARADAIILVQPADIAQPDPDLMALMGNLPILIARLLPIGPPPSGLQLGFAGIGKPWKVERSLRLAGCQLVDFAPFPDHMAYAEPVLNALAQRAASLDAGLVTTEKDWVRLSPDWRAKVTPWPIKAVFDDPAALTALLDLVVAKADHSQTPGR